MARLPHLQTENSGCITSAGALIDYHTVGIFPSDDTVYQLEPFLDSTEQNKLLNARLEFIAAERVKIDHVLRHGYVADPAITQRYDHAKNKYCSLLSSYYLQFPEVMDPFSRSEFDISPYETPGKNALNETFPAWSAAQDGLWPGYERDEHFELYPFLRKTEGLIPFLKKHNIYYNFPETFARYGGAFVSPPNATLEENIALRKHLDQCHHYLHTAPTASPDTPKEELQFILSYYEDDFRIVIMDGPTVIGVVGREDLENASDNCTAADCMQKNWKSVPSAELDPVQYFECMNQSGIDFLLDTSHTSSRIVTKTTASLSHFLPPFKYKNGLGSVVYIPMGDADQAINNINELMKEADGIPGIIIETAHGGRKTMLELTRRVRKKFQDLFIATGTLVDPTVAAEFLHDFQKETSGERESVDAVKIGVARGGACETKHTGVATSDLHAALQVGAAIYGNGTMIVDGAGTPDEFVIGLCPPSTRARQAGGAALRREAANPWVKNPNGNGQWGKYYRGMANGSVAAEKLRSQGNLSVPKQMMLALGMHSEGREVFKFSRAPTSIGRFFLALGSYLRSAMSYSAVNTRSQIADLMQFQQNTILLPVEPKDIAHKYKDPFAKNGESLY